MTPPDTYTLQTPQDSAQTCSHFIASHLCKHKPCLDHHGGKTLCRKTLYRWIIGRGTFVYNNFSLSNGSLQMDNWWNDICSQLFPMKSTTFFIKKEKYNIFIE